MLKLIELRSEVYIRLRDFDQKIDPTEIDREINRSLDIWTRDSEALQLMLEQNITEGVNPITLTPAPGFEIASILGIKIYQDGEDAGIVTLRSVYEMDREYPNWRDPDFTATVPHLGVLNFKPTSAGSVPIPDSLFLVPWPGEDLTAGLVVDYVAVTKDYLTQDDSEVPLKAVQCKEWLLERVCAELSHRMEMEEVAMYHEKAYTKEGGRQRKIAATQGRGGSCAKVYFN